MKKKLFVIILALAMVLTLCACGNDAASTPDASGDKADAPQTEPQKLIVGFDAEFPPFGFIAEDGSYDGFDLAMAEELCARLGWEFEAVPIDWTQKDNELSSGAINCIWNGFTCTGREDLYTWSDPYVDNSIVVVVKADSGIASLADLAGKVIMAQGASSAADAINGNEEFKATLAEVIELPDYNAGFMELKMGTVDAIAADLGVAQFQIANNEGDYIILDEAISTEQYAVGFLLGNTALRDAVNAELKAMAQDGTMLAIAEKYVEAGLVIDSLCMLPSGDKADAPAAEPQKLVVGFDAEFPPFGFLAEDGSYDGFDLAMAEELCARLGWEFEAVPIDWTQKDNELASGAINCIWNGFTCTGREDMYTWSDPYVDNSIVVVVKADSGITSLADLAGKVVMAQGASSAADAIYGNTDFYTSLAQLVELADYNSGFMELKMGSVDAVAADLGVAQFQIANNEGDYIILDEAISTEQYAVGFLLGNTELRDAVNAELKAMAEDGTMLAIAEKYVDAGLVIDSLCMLG